MSCSRRVAHSVKIENRRCCNEGRGRAIKEGDGVDQTPMKTPRGGASGMELGLVSEFSSTP